MPLNKQHSDTMPQWKSGDPIRATQLNSLSSKVSEHIVAGQGIQIQRDGARTIVGLAGGPVGRLVPSTGGGGTPIVTVLTAVRDDYMECQYWNIAASSGGAAVNIAKPDLLQTTFWDGKTVTDIQGNAYTYTYDSTYPHYRRGVVHANGLSETQIIAPMYSTGEVILGVSSATGITSTTGAGAVAFVDINNAGRMWARMS